MFCYLIAKLDIFHLANPMLRFIGFICWNIDYGLDLGLSTHSPLIFSFSSYSLDVFRLNLFFIIHEENLSHSHNRIKSDCEFIIVGPKLGMWTQQNRECYELNFHIQPQLFHCARECVSVSANRTFAGASDKVAQTRACRHLKYNQKNKDIH